MRYGFLGSGHLVRQKEKKSLSPDTLPGLKIYQKFSCGHLLDAAGDFQPSLRLPASWIWGPQRMREERRIGRGKRGEEGTQDWKEKQRKDKEGIVRDKKETGKRMKGKGNR